MPGEGGRSFVFALTDLCVEIGEAVACLMLGRVIWRDEPDERAARGEPDPHGQ